MRYTIPAVDQRAALHVGDIDLTDCHLLQWLFYFCNSRSKRIERDAAGGTWVSYTHLAADMPLLRLTPSAIGARIKKLTQKGYLTTTYNRGLRKTYITLTEKIERLFGDEPLHAGGVENQSHSTQVEWPLHAGGVENVVDSTEVSPLKKPLHPNRPSI